MISKKMLPQKFLDQRFLDFGMPDGSPNSDGPTKKMVEAIIK